MGNENSIQFDSNVQGSLEPKIDVVQETGKSHSEFVECCKKAVEGTRRLLIEQVEAYEVDAELRIKLIDIIEKHISAVDCNEYSNASALGIFALGNKIMDEIRNFKFSVIGIDQAYRYTGIEEKILEKVVNPLMMALGAKINEFECQKNLRTNIESQKS